MPTSPAQSLAIKAPFHTPLLYTATNQNSDRKSQTAIIKKIAIDHAWKRWQSVCSFTGIQSPQWSLQKNPRGAPYLKYVPLTPATLKTAQKKNSEQTITSPPHISIAHSPFPFVEAGNTKNKKNFIATAFFQHAIGVDCEWVNTALPSQHKNSNSKSLMQLAKRYFSKQEIVELKAASSDTRFREIFFQNWTLKEALTKAAHLPLLTGIKTDTYRLDDCWQWQYFTTNHRPTGYMAITVVWKNHQQKLQSNPNIEASPVLEWVSIEA